MRLNHINLPVSNLGESRAFLETYFDLRHLGGSDDGPVVVLMDESGSIVTLSNFNHADTVKYPGAFHIGFVQPSNAAVDAMSQRFLAEGHVAGEPKELDGRYTFYIKAPGGFIVEVLGPMPGIGFPTQAQ